MKQRRSRKQPNRSHSDTPFFADTNREQVPRSGTPFFHRADVARQSPDKEEETASQSKEQDEETSQSVDDRELARQGEREDEAVAENAEREEETAAQDAVEREDESAAQESGEREEETATQESGEREEETVAQDADEREEITGQDAEREEEMVAQAITVSRRSDTHAASRRRLHSGAGQPARGGTTPDVQRIPSLNWSNSLRDQIRQMIAQGQTYAQMRPVIRGASFWERLLARIDANFLREIQQALVWNDFARIVELLGGPAPDGGALVANPAVQAALGDAWTDSNAAATGWTAEDPAHPQHGNCSPSQTNLPTAAQTGTHEEGGWIYLNVITGGIYTRRASPGAQATLNLGNPPQILDSVVVGAFHTHPNLGACWGVQPGQADSNFSQFVGVPLIARGMPGNATQDFVTPPPAPQRRAHLAGPRGFPMAGGAIAPQPRVNTPQTLSKIEARVS